MADFRQNLLLAALSAAQLKRLAPHLEAIEMPLGDTLYESGRQPATKQAGRMYIFTCARMHWSHPSKRAAIRLWKARPARHAAY